MLGLPVVGLVVGLGRLLVTFGVVGTELEEFVCTLLETGTVVLDVGTVRLVDELVNVDVELKAIVLVEVVVNGGVPGTVVV